MRYGLRHVYVPTGTATVSLPMSSRILTVEDVLPNVIILTVLVPDNWVHHPEDWDMVTRHVHVVAIDGDVDVDTDAHTLQYVGSTPRGYVFVS